MIKITERDKDFLLALNKTGACNAKLPLAIYPKRYARTRLERMEAEGIINRNYDLITLAYKSKKYLESIGEIPKMVYTLTKKMQKRLAKVSELSYKLPNMEVVSSAEYKKKHNLNRGMQFVAAATTIAKTTYLIYDVPKKLTAVAKTQLLRELKNKKNQVNNAIIFTKNKELVQTLSTDNVYICELLLLPPKDFLIDIVNVMAEGNFDRKVIGVAFPELVNNKVFDEKQNQCRVGNNYYLNLVLNNISTFNIIKSLDVQAIQNNNTCSQIYNIVCLDIQEKYIKNTLRELDLKKLNVQIKTITAGESSFY